MNGPTGLDTGFFLALSRGDPLALSIFQGPGELVVSALSLYELQKKLREAGNARWLEILDDLARSVRVVPVTAKTALSAGELAREYGLPAGAAMILASFLEAGCETAYTADKRLARAAPPGIEIIAMNLEARPAGLPGGAGRAAPGDGPEAGSEAEPGAADDA